MTKRRKVITIVAVTVAVLVVAISITAVLLWSGVMSKKITSDAEYRILQITDAHLNSDNSDDWAFETIDMMIKSSEPDLIIVTGDISSNVENESDIRKFAEYIESFKIEWTFTFGNHDAEGNWKKKEISDYLMSLEYCSYESGFTVEKYGHYSDDSIGNSYRNIYDSKGNFLTTIFLMDSNMYYNDKENGIEGYSNFYKEQVEWYKQSVKRVALEINGNASKVAPSLAFFHIPMQEFDSAYKSGNRLNGGKMEKVYSSVIEDQMFETMVELQSTKGVFVGHDHVNSFTAELNGIKLSYSYSTDHRLYFVMQKGGNVITIKQNGEFDINGIYRNLGRGQIVITNRF